MPKAKPSQDIDASLGRFLSAARRNRDGIQNQQRRILSKEGRLPRLLEGTLNEVLDFTDSFANDIDYYIYEVGRLLDLVQDEAFVVFSVPNTERANETEPARIPPRELVEARDAFIATVPKLKEVRNALTHFDDGNRLDDFGTFSAAVNFLPGGGVEYLVDPRYQHHDAALALSDALFAFLRRLLKERMAEEPAPPLLEQIRLREAKRAASGGEVHVGEVTGA